jgi:hypothetical protein
MELLNACVNINAFEDQNMYVCEQLFKLLKLDGIWIFLLDVACK